MKLTKSELKEIIHETFKEELKKSLKEEAELDELEEMNLTWEEFLDKADEFLEELCDESGNPEWDDADGYDPLPKVWCNRKLYYGRLENVDTLENLCKRYSRNLPGLRFYSYNAEDEDDVSEIGYYADIF
jgi:hypothetical protein